MEKLYDYYNNLIQPNTFYKNCDMIAFVYSRSDQLYCDIITRGGTRFGFVKLSIGNSNGMGIKISPDRLISDIEKDKTKINKDISNLESCLKGLNIQKDFIKENSSNKNN